MTSQTQGEGVKDFCDDSSLTIKSGLMSKLHVTPFMDEPLDKIVVIHNVNAVLKCVMRQSQERNLVLGKTELVLNSLTVCYLNSDCKYTCKQDTMRQRTVKFLRLISLFLRLNLFYRIAFRYVLKMPEQKSMEGKEKFLCCCFKGKKGEEFFPIQTNSNMQILFHFFCQINCFLLSP